MYGTHACILTDYEGDKPVFSSREYVHVGGGIVPLVTVDFTEQPTGLFHETLGLILIELGRVTRPNLGWFRSMRLTSSDTEIVRPF